MWLLLVNRYTCAQQDPSLDTADILMMIKCEQKDHQEAALFIQPEVPCITFICFAVFTQIGDGPGKTEPA